MGGIASVPQGIFLDSDEARGTVIRRRREQAGVRTAAWVAS